MPRRKVQHTQEHRVTLGEYERKMMEKQQLTQLVKALGLPVGLAAIGLAAVMAAMAISGLLKEWLQGIQDMLDGADSEKRKEVNAALDNDPSIDEYTPQRWQGMSASAIYDVQFNMVNDIKHRAYTHWLGDMPDNSTNFTYFNLHHNIKFGPNHNRISHQRAATGEGAENPDGETDYNGFAWQVTIRETAARRYVAYVGGNLATNSLIKLFGSLSNLDWTSRNVSEAPGFIDDSLLWAAWARASFDSVTGMGGANLGWKLSQYRTEVEASFEWEEQMYLFYQMIQSTTDIPWPDGWLPSEPPLSS